MNGLLSIGIGVSHRPVAIDADASAATSRRRSSLATSPWAPAWTCCWSLTEAPSMPIPVTQTLVGASAGNLSAHAASSRNSSATRLTAASARSSWPARRTWKSTTATENSRVRFVDEPDEPVRDGVRGACRVAQHRPAQTDLLDDPLGPWLPADGHVVALEVRTFDEDQEPHHVVQDDILGREHDSDHDDDDRREDRPQVEDGEDHDHEPGQHGQAEELLQQVLDRPDPLADLVGRARTRREMRGLRADDGGDETMDQGEPDPVDDQQHDGADQQADAPGEEPAEASRSDPSRPSAVVHRPERNRNAPDRSGRGRPGCTS